MLIVLTVRTIGQEKELTQKRRTEERRRVAREIGQQLLVRLEGIKLQETSAVSERQLMPAEIDYVNPDVVLICLIEGRQLVLPWEINQEIDNARRYLDDPAYSQKIRQAEREEFVQKNNARAARLYQQAVNSAKHPVQREYARLLLARVLSKSSQKAEALANFQEILRLPFTVADEYGIPLSLYAAGRLIDYEENYEDVLRLIQKEVQKEHWLSPSGSYLLLDLLEDFLLTATEAEIREAANDCKKLVQKHIQKLEQGMALQNDFLTLGLAANQNDQTERKNPLWVLYGNNPWLISLSASLSERPPVLVALSAQKIIASLRADSDFKEAFPAEFNIVPENDTDGLSLGSNLKGLAITFTENQEQMFSTPWSIQPAFYLLALLLILGITLFGAYLLWRDVRREVQMAEMRSQFVSSVSHELKTPLTAIRMFAETLRLGRSKDTKTQNEYLDTIVNESQRLTRLLNNVLDFSKIERGRRLYRPELASLYEIVESAARAMEYPLSQQGFRLDVQTEEGLPKVRVDRDAIEQALLNLLHNAMKYSGESKEIGLHMKKKDGHALIQVIDQGIGIGPQEQKRIFEKFYRIPSPENERIVGTGLGLALVSHIVEAHGGSLELESASGKGSTFSIYLPLEKET
ncbi:MAG: HAMP domain-containing histidine kinase [Candidatus Aminicenantes bacterium]|nr:HAMP domain-containing histidine kinase [Candidatus Aminicenantes bacterium]